MNTCYVPLEHPFKIIEYQGVLGIQIGTLVVTIDKSEGSKKGYSIETHSHPVVSYVNNKINTDTENRKSLSLPIPYEGVVWDKVELQELRTLAREGEKLSWADFMDYCRRLRLGEIEGTHKNVDAVIMNNYGILLDWGIEIDWPEGAKRGIKQILLEIDSFSTDSYNEYIVTEGDMGIVVKKSDDILMISQLFSQVEYFIKFMRHYSIPDGMVKFWTRNIFLQDLTNILNKRWKVYKDNRITFLNNDDDFDGSWAAEDISYPEPNK